MKVVICDPHALFAEALQNSFEQRGYEALVTASPRAAAVAVARGGVDIVLTEIVFPSEHAPYGDRSDAAGAVAHIVAVDPQVRVVVLTASFDRQALQDAVAEGAVAVAHKSQPLAELLVVLDRVQAGEAVLSGQLMRAAMNRNQSSEHSLASFLTAREREVLARLTQGESTREIARSMGVAYSTARTHIQSVLDKLGVHSRLEAAAFAARHQLNRASSAAEEASRRDV
jgi:two-component system, NarL family, nitrate/nitrite response regulator NarL